jgi:hypothetical protein
MIDPAPEGDTTMHLIPTAENQIRLDMAGDEFETVSDEVPLSPYHLVAAGLASCTALTVQSWAAAASIDLRGLMLTIAWTVASERPRRISHMDMVMQWPGAAATPSSGGGARSGFMPDHETLKRLNRSTQITRRIMVDGNQIAASPERDT